MCSRKCAVGKMLLLCAPYMKYEMLVRYPFCSLSTYLSLTFYMIVYYFYFFLLSSILVIRSFASSRIINKWINVNNVITVTVAAN